MKTRWLKRKMTAALLKVRLNINFSVLLSCPFALFILSCLLCSFSYPVFPCLFLSSSVRSCPALTCPTSSFPVNSFPVSFFPVLSCPCLSRPFLFCAVLYCLILFCLLLPCPLLPFPLPFYPLLYYPVIFCLLLLATSHHHKSDSVNQKEMSRNKPHNDEEIYNFIYILHPKAITGLSWRQKSKKMPQ